MIAAGAAGAASADTRDLLTLDVMWAVRLDSPPVARPIADERRAYVALGSGQLVALTLQEGREVWRADLGPLHGLSAGDGRVFAVARDAIAALEAATGSPAWRVDLATAGVSPTWRSGWLLAGAASGELLALRAADGSVVWRKPLGAPLRHPVTIEGERSYAALVDGSLVALDVTTGAVHWRTQTAGVAGPVLAAGDRVYVGAEDNFFYALDAADGRRRWRWRTGGDVIGRPALDDRRVYFVSLDNVVRALDARSGVQQWRRPLDSRPRAGAVLVEGLLVIGGLGAELRMLRAEDGVVAGRWTAPGELAQPPLILPPPSGAQAGAPRAVIVTGAVSGDWRAYGLGRALEPPPTPLKEIPGRPLSLDGPPALPEPPPPDG